MSNAKGNVHFNSLILLCCYSYNAGESSCVHIYMIMCIVSSVKPVLRDLPREQ